MSAQHRQKRLPISCEPCRIRKIRCSRPRGPPPCETCVRRGLASDCLYAGRGSTASSARPLLPPSPLSERSISTASLPDGDLAARVAKLESLLQSQTSREPAPSSTRLLSPLPKCRGALSVSESGHVRFTSFPLSSSSSQPLSNPRQATSCSIDLSSGPYPFGRKQVDIKDLLVDLPARSHCTQLKEVYFESFASLFHILHDPTFCEQYAEFERAPESMPLSWLALLFAILGTSVTALGHSSQLLSDLSRKKTVASKISDLSERYRNAALKCLEADNYLWQHNVTTLQALIILIYGINHSHGQTWTLLGMTYHIALSMGCHVDPAEFDLDVVSSEERRRCWAGVMMLYMLQNTSLGHLGPDPRHASEGIRLPADLNDTELITGESALPSPSGLPTQMSYLLLKFRLYDISSDICSLVLNKPQPTLTLIDRMDEAILNEQQSWNDKYLAHSTSAPLPVFHEAHLNILYGYGHQLTLLLHHQAMRNLSSDTAQYRRSATRCINSSKDLLQIHSLFSSRAEFSPFGWYLRGIGSFHAFHAAVSLIAILTGHPWNEAFGDLLPLIQDCVHRFETLAEVSLICEKASPVLRYLLNTIETWSIEIGSQRSSNHPLGQNTFSRNHLQSPPESDRVSDWPSSGNEVDETCQSMPAVVDNMFDHLDPQFWLTPSGVAWNQWDSILSSMPVASCVG
ncbi:hypothetical protein BKA66DRAFT_258254 [Pyrenochaeta sp. MPI-SDFR-AT-0127]|nr:hypothetical protein BKA66DRAFT_258254 [Pyrenochaeta sp. MPI-SDFR-AT-0127]